MSSRSLPRAAIQKGHVNKIIPLEGIGTFLVNQYGGGDRVPLERSDKTEKGDRPEKIEKNDKNERTPVSSQRT